MIPQKWIDKLMTLYIKETGDPNGDSILFLHGSMTASPMWEGVTERLPHFHHILVDLHAHGESHAVKPISLNQMADDLAPIIASCGKKGRAHLVGLSLGGMIAIKLLERHANIINRSIVSGVNALPIPNARFYNLMMNLMIPLMRLDPFIRMNARALNIGDEDYEQYRWIAKQFNGSAFKQVMPEALNFSVSDTLTRVDNPTLFVAGGKEHPINIKSVTMLAQIMPEAVGVLAPDVHHAWVAELPDLFADMVRAWFTDQPLPMALIPVSEASLPIA